MEGSPKTPKKISLLGDKTKRPEPAQHVIEFPGGAVEVSRTSDGDYWAHIIVNRDQPVDDCDGLRLVKRGFARKGDDGIYYPVKADAS